MFDRDSKFYHAATAAMFLSILILGWLFMTRAAGADEIFVEGQREHAQCETLYIEPVEVRCVSDRHVCIYYAETGQFECVRR